MSLKWLQWLCLWLLLATSGTAAAQALDPGDSNAALAGNANLPAWAVPVLRLVSATHVEPTTGIVISSSGLVLVPADFARIGDEVIVLDGGTDIIRYGRPARIERSFRDAGVDVLVVDGLQRPAASLAMKPIADGAGVALAAFPPAEEIEKGAPPLSVPVTLVVFAENGNAAVSAETPLPNVTGPLIDACGDLVGFSLAHDIQTMESSPETRYAWLPELRQVYADLGIEAAASRCPGTNADVTEPAAAEPEAAAAEPPPEAPEPEEAAADEEEPGAEEPAPETQPEAETLDIDILPPIEREDRIAATEEESRVWPGLWLLAAAALFGLGLLLHRWRRRTATPVDGQSTAQPADLTAESPEAGLKDVRIADPALDHHLLLEGILPDGTEFTARCPVSAQAVNVLIGRGGADLVIDSPAVSRRHASLNGSRGQLTLTDLGSSNGTSINGVPVMEGEVMYVEPGDTVVLGNVACTIAIGHNGGRTEDGA